MSTITERNSNPASARLSREGSYHVPTLKERLEADRRKQIRKIFLEQYGEKTGQELFEIYDGQRPPRRIFRKRRQYPRLGSGQFKITKKNGRHSIKSRYPVHVKNKILCNELFEFYTSSKGELELRVRYVPLTRGELVDQNWVAHLRKRSQVADGDVNIGGIDCAVTRGQVSGIVELIEDSDQDFSSSEYSEQEFSSSEESEQEYSSTYDSETNDEYSEDNIQNGTTIHQLHKTSDHTPIQKGSLKTIIKNLIEKIQRIATRVFQWFCSLFTSTRSICEEQMSISSISDSLSSDDQDEEYINFFE